MARASATAPTHPLRLWPRLGLALGAGALTGLGFAPVGLWPATIIGLAVLYWLVIPGRPRQAAGVGYVFGMGLFTVTIWWSAVMGWWVGAVFIAFLSTWMLGVALGVHVVAGLPGWPVWAACVWSMYEFGAIRFPFSGFGWVRLAYTTPEQPLGGYLPWIGAAGTGWLVALCAALIVWPRGTRALTRLGGLLLVLALFAAGLVLLTRPVAAGGPTVGVGMVQGDVDETASRTTMGRPRSVTAYHLSETVTLLARARTGLDPAPDFVLWPENATDYDALADQATADWVNRAVAIAGVPILLGTITEGPGANERQTTSLWWVPGHGPTARYDKRNVVPFGEYLPLRPLMLKLFPITQEVGPQSVPGKLPGVLPVRLPDGRPLAVGDLVCYDLAYDETVYDTVRHGAQVLTVQSSNVTFTGTNEPAQQFQITRVRAMELRREIVVATTSSLSGLIDAKGRVVDRTAPSTAAARTYQVPERAGTSAAVSVGPWWERTAAGIGLLAVLAGLVLGIGARRARGAAGRPQRTGARRTHG